MTKGITGRDVYSNVVAEKLGFDEETTMDCFEYFESKGYVKIVRPKPITVQFDLIHITSEGVEEVEKSRIDAESHRGNLDSQLRQDIRLFISYAKEDCEKALKLYRGLKKERDLKPWIDKESLLPGQKWKVAISNSIRDSRFFVALLFKFSK